MKILLGRKEVNPDEPDSCYKTSLPSASEHGSEGVMKILLGREDVNPNCAYEDGRTLLMMVTRWCY